LKYELFEPIPSIALLLASLRQSQAISRSPGHLQIRECRLNEDDFEPGRVVQFGTCGGRSVQPNVTPRRYAEHRFSGGLTRLYVELFSSAAGAGRR
jgi:hypothetical protein